MTTINDLYDYGLKIYQNEDYFKFSLDSILLAEFVKFHRFNTVLDLCTGNAPIPLILSQRDTTLKMTGIEIQKDIYQLATKSIQINSLTERINIINADAKDYDSPYKYDIVTCNPPYFKVSKSTLKNENEIKRTARHEVSITLEDVIKTAKKNLKENGTFYLVHRVDRFLETLELLKKYKLKPRDIVFVFTKSGQKAEFFLIEASTYKRADPKVYEIHTSNCITYKRIFEEGK